MCSSPTVTALRQAREDFAHFAAWDDDVRRVGNRDASFGKDCELLPDPLFKVLLHGKAHHWRTVLFLLVCDEGSWATSELYVGLLSERLLRTQLNFCTFGAEEALRRTNFFRGCPRQVLTGLSRLAVQVYIQKVGLCDPESASLPLNG